VHPSSLALKELALGDLVSVDTPTCEIEIVPPGGGDLSAACSVHTLTVRSPVHVVTPSCVEFR
jgi:hypothetical protein